MGAPEIVVPSRSPDFYWDFVVFQVQEKLYKVPRHVFENSSEIFGSMFDLPVPGDIALREGLTDEKPIVLPVESAQFDALLIALLTDTRYVSYIDAGLSAREQWLSVLHLANMWHMVNMRQLAITQLSTPKMSDVDRIVYGQQHAVVDWVLSGYREIASRSIVITLSDMERLGNETCLQIWQVQLKAWSQSQHYGSYQNSLKRLLAEMFSALVNDAYQRGVNLGDDERAPRPSF